MRVLLNEASKYSKKYKCPYCEKRLDKQNLIRHIEEKHSESVPEGFTPSRIVFNLINKKDHGSCIECRRETQWNEEKCRYERLCGRVSCAESYKRKTEARIKKIYGKTSREMLNDPEHQAKMLAGRSISGEYRWSNGDKKIYTGTYELECLKFLDSFGFKSEDIVTPGPVVDYIFNGEKHIWITDIYIAPYNLAIDCKDGGDNPNNRDMKEYREKQIQKEKAIAVQGKYNYLRLTDNKFDQLLEVITLLKLQFLENNKDERIIKINENMFASIGGFMPPANADDTYIVNYMQNNVFVPEIAVANNLKLEKIIRRNEDGKLIIGGKEFLEDCQYTVYRCNKGANVNRLLKELGSEVSDSFIYETLFEKSLYTFDQFFTEDIVEVPDYYHYLSTVQDIVENSMMQDIAAPTLEDHVFTDSNGKFFMMNESGTLRTPSKDTSEFSDLEKKIISEGIF